MAPLRAAKQLPTILWEIIWHKSPFLVKISFYAWYAWNCDVCVFLPFRLVPQQSKSFFLCLFLRVFGLVLLFALFLFLFFWFSFSLPSSPHPDPVERSCWRVCLFRSLPQSHLLVKNKDPDMSKHLMRSNHKESNNNPQKTPVCQWRRNSFFTLFLPVNQIQMGILAKCICIKFLKNHTFEHFMKRKINNDIKANIKKIHN